MTQNPQTLQVEVQINSVNFICDWKYDVKSGSMKCCFCHNHASYQSRSQLNCTLKVHGLVAGKCGRIAHLSCYKKQNRQQNNNEIIFEFDKNLEENHTQKLYRV